MSKYIHISFKVILCLVLGFILESCGGFDLQEYPKAVEYPLNISVRADVDTRIALDGLSLTWEQNDTLSISALASDGSYSNSEVTVYEIDPDNPSSASFSGFITMLAPPQECYFMHPNTAATSYNASTGRVKFQYNSQTGRHEPFLYAKTAYNEDGINVNMKHIGSVLQISVQIPEISTITFAGNSLENIYPVEVDPDTEKVFFSNEIGVQITVPVQTDGPTYICVPPVKLEKGFSLICSKSDGTYLVKSFSSDGTISGGYDFTTKVGSLIPIELKGDFEKFEISAASLVTTHSKNAGLLTGTDVKFNINKTGISNKLIEEWGANLLNSDGQVVRTVKYTNMTPISGQTVLMNVANNWKLLPEGDYIFTPYYKMYGQIMTLPSQLLSVADPEVTVTLNGTTSYDKYTSGNTSGANSHTNTLIENVSVSTNLDLSIIDSRDLKLDGTSLGSGTWSSGTMVYGNQTKSEFRLYECVATIVVGNLTFSASCGFNITGLPYEVNFSNGDNTVWAKLGGAKYSNQRITFESGSWGSAKDGAVVSPKFHTPSNINVKTSVDACGAHTQAKNRTVYIKSISSNTKLEKGSSTIESTYKVDYSSSGYKACDTQFSLTSSTPYMIYTASPALYNLALFKIKIEYN